MTDLPKLIALRHAAAQLGVTLSALRAEMQRGRLAVRRIGKNLYVTPADLDAMVEQCRVEPCRPVLSCAGRPQDRHGSSATANATSALDVLKTAMRTQFASSPDGSKSRPSLRLVGRDGRGIRR